ncbi:MAG: hypothetical protein ACI9UA_002427 [Pseudoalteromonas tetraodonis]
MVSAAYSNSILLDVTGGLIVYLRNKGGLRNFLAESERARDQLEPRLNPESEKRLGSCREAIEVRRQGERNGLRGAFIGPVKPLCEELSQATGYKIIAPWSADS